MMLASPVSRLACELCLRPQSTCICRWISPTHTVELVVLLHPLEE